MNLSRIQKRLKEDGIFVTSYLVSHNIKKKLRHQDAYQRWIELHEKGILETKILQYQPLISIIVPVYNVKKEQLEECIASVLQQTYTNWQLCLVDDASTMKEVAEVLKQYEEYEKIDILYRKENGNISKTTNDGIQLAKGEFLGLLDCDDILAPNALYEVAKKLNENKKWDFIYSDEDFLTENGKKRYNPTFKGKWSPDTFMSVMHTNHFSVFRKTIADDIGGYRIGYEGSQDYDFVLRFTEKTKQIGYINKILYHWRAREESVASNPETKMYAYKAAMKAKEDALKRRSINGRVEYLENLYQSRIIYENEKNPLVSIIIPSKDNILCLKKCIQSIVERTSYSNYEIIVVDNGSSEENKIKYEALCQQYNAIYKYIPMAFNFSKMCNIGTDISNGEFLLFLNDDTEIIEKVWLERMVGHASLSHTGAVGAKLYYPESHRIQHAGVVNQAVGPGHFFLKEEERKDVYRLHMECNYCAVTGACMMLEKKKFDEVGTFDESFPVGYNDIELCFRLIEKGYYNVVRNDAVLYHYESISRGNDLSQEKARRLRKEKERLYEKHPVFLNYDPYYSEYYDNMGKLDNVYDSKPVKGLQLNKRVFEHFENVDEKNMFLTCSAINYSKINLLKVSGTFFFIDRTDNNYNKITVLLKNQQEECYEFKLKKLYGDEFGREIEHTGNIKLTGFLGTLDISDLKAGVYEVYIIIKTRVGNNIYQILTNETITLS